MSAAQARRWRGRADLPNDLRVLIRRCRIKAVFNTSRDQGVELRVRQALHSYSLFTIVLVSLSQSTGTVTRPV